MIVSVLLATSSDTLGSCLHSAAEWNVSALCFLYSLTKELMPRTCNLTVVCPGSSYISILNYVCVESKGFTLDFGMLSYPAISLDVCQTTRTFLRRLLRMSRWTVHKQWAQCSWRAWSAWGVRTVNCQIPWVQCSGMKHLYCTCKIDQTFPGRMEFPLVQCLLHVPMFLPGNTWSSLDVWMCCI